MRFWLCPGGRAKKDFRGLSWTYPKVLSFEPGKIGSSHRLLAIPLWAGLQEANRIREESREISVHLPLAGEISQELRLNLESAALRSLQRQRRYQET